MLVLTLGRDDELVLGTGANQIRVQVTKVGQTYVRLTTLAPKEVRILRGELQGKPRKGAA